MKLCLNESWESFEKEVENAGKGIVLFGASSCAEVFLNRLKQSHRVDYLVDNDSNKQGKKWEERYDICSPEKLKESGNGEILLITSTYHAEIIQQLERLKFRGSVYSFLHLRNKVEQNLDRNALKEKIERLKGLMSDSRSKEIIDAIFQKRMEDINDFSDIMEDNQYFVKELVKKDKDAVFVDGGAYDGETVRQFQRFQDNCFKKVYSFEMDKENFDRIDKGKFDNRVNFLNYGLWNERKTVSFIAQSRSSEIAEEGNAVAECISLDEVIAEGEKVTFIKMDIEGAEQNALLGAKRILTEDKPQLAICLYHSLADLWEIPFLIHDMVPEYKFLIRHHSPTYEETVLYATC